MAQSANARGGSEAHWDSAYRDHGTRGVSWFQPEPTVSVELIHHLDVPADAAVLDVGGGASTLVDALLAEGFSDLCVLDISEEALKALRQRLPADAPVTLIHADLLAWTPERTFDLWHDRAVFHFLVDEAARRAYLDGLRQGLHAGGHVIVGAFAPDGPQYCSGLPVARYTAGNLSEALGADFDVVERRREEHITPTGAMQPFTWLAARFRG
jgi:SAM-dependent methyltransferase